MFYRIRVKIIFTVFLMLWLNFIFATPPNNQEMVITSPLEGDENTINYFFLQINKPLNFNVSVNYETKDGTAKGGQDFVDTKGIATIHAGDTYTTISVEIIGDNLIENNESFSLEISNPVGASFPPDVNKITINRTIIDDDDLNNLPLISIDDLEYIGGFRIKSGSYGESKTGFSDGKIAYNNKSLYVSGHRHDGAIAEFLIPEIINANTIGELNISQPPIQNYSKLLNRTHTGNNQNINRIGGFEFINNQLIVHGYEYYDADFNVTNTTLVVNEANKLATSDVSGYFNLNGGAHTVLWISPIPIELQQLFDGDYISGASSAFPISVRSSNGPSAFVLSSDDLLEPEEVNITTIPLLDYDLEHIMALSEHGWLPYSEWKNGLEFNYYGMNLRGEYFLVNYDGSQVGSNNLWTNGSNAVYGLIIPNTRTYAVFGNSSMHLSGGGYRIMQKDGNICNGPCPFDPLDRYNYYWLFDISDLYDVKLGKRNSYDVKPYSYGLFTTPLDIIEEPSLGESYKVFINGGTFNKEESIIYFSLLESDKLQNIFEPPPVVLAYKILH